MSRRSVKEARYSGPAFGCPQLAEDSASLSAEIRRMPGKEGKGGKEGIGGKGGKDGTDGEDGACDAVIFSCSESDEPHMGR